MISKEEQEYRIALGMSLKKYREMNGLSLREVASATNINRGSLYNYENGSRRPNEERIKQLADLYRTNSSLIHQGAADRLEFGFASNINSVLDVYFDLDGAHIIVKSKITEKEERFRLPEQSIADIKNKFNL